MALYKVALFFTTFFKEIGSDVRKSVLQASQVRKTRILHRPTDQIDERQAVLALSLKASLTCQRQSRFIEKTALEIESCLFTRC